MTVRHPARRGHVKRTVLFLLERPSAADDIVARGQVWVKDTTPNQLFFTNDVGTDIQLSGSGSTVNVADESTDTTCFPLFVTAATGDLQPKSASGLTFNSNTDDLNSTLIAGIANANLVDKAASEVITGAREWQGNVGFYSTTPIAQQTSVAVTAAGIHAALVNLGLITA